MSVDSRNILFQLLRLSFNEQTLVSIPIDVDWREVMLLSLQQGIGGIAFRGVERLPMEQRPPIDLYLEWLGQCEVVEEQTKAQYASAARLSTTWHEQGIRTLVLKGFALALMYPDPALRPSNDLDCFLCGKFEEGNLVVENMGIPVSRGDYRHSTFDFEQVHVENHKICTTVRGKKQRKRFESYLQSLLMEEPTQTLPNSFLEVPCGLFNAYYFLQHAHRHFLREGITLRYVCDWAMILNQDNCNPDDTIFTDDFWNTCEANDLKSFAESLSRLAFHVFGINAPWLGGEDCVLEQDELFLADSFDISNHAIKYGVSIRAHSQMVKNMVSQRWKYRYFSKDGFLQDILSSVVGVLFEKEPIIE